MTKATLTAWYTRPRFKNQGAGFTGNYGPVKWTSIKDEVEGLKKFIFWLALFLLIYNMVRK